MRNSPIHAAAEAFDSVADLYERARPGFPDAALDHLVERLGIAPGTTVVDLGAGTGKLARRLVPTGARVVAVEPLESMRAKAAELVPGLEILAGTAEAIPLPDGFAEAVVAAQAFHWFRGEEALAEIHRVLHPGGALALVWNRRDMEDPLQRAFERAIERHRGNAPAHRSYRWRDVFERTALFGPLELSTFPFVHEMDRETLVARAASISFVAALPDEERRSVLDDVAALVEGRPEPFPFPYVTEVYVSARR